MANTTNLNLVKPAGTDYALVSVINGNMDIIDSKVGAVPSNASVQGQIDTLNNQVTQLNSNSNVTNDILTTAVSATRSSFYNGSGSSYTGNVPNSNYKYGIFIVNVRNTRKFVIAISTNNDVAICAYDGSSWTAWTELATNNKQTLTATTNASGQIISDIAFENIKSVNVASTVDYYCACRRSTAGKAVFFVFNGSFQQVANTEVTLSVWTI